MPPLELDRIGLQSKKRLGAFTLFTNLSWTGCILVGDAGCAAPESIADLAEGLTLGSVALVLNASDGHVIAAKAHHGDQGYAEPRPHECLVILTAEPMLLPPRALDCIAAALAGDTKILDLEEVQRANALNFLSCISRAGIGELSPSVGAWV